jgi:hypothetical protein
MQSRGRRCDPSVRRQSARSARCCAQTVAAYYCAVQPVVLATVGARAQHQRVHAAQGHDRRAGRRRIARVPSEPGCRLRPLPGPTRAPLAACCAKEAGQRSPAGTRTTSRSIARSCCRNRGSRRRDALSAAVFSHAACQLQPIAAVLPSARPESQPREREPRSGPDSGRLQLARSPSRSAARGSRGREREPLALASQLQRHADAAKPDRSRRFARGSGLRNTAAGNQPNEALHTSTGHQTASCAHQLTRDGAPQTPCQGTRDAVCGRNKAAASRSVTVRAVRDRSHTQRRAGCTTRARRARAASTIKLRVQRLL